MKHCISKRNQCNEYIFQIVYSSSCLCLWSKIDKLIERHNRTHTQWIHISNLNHKQTIDDNNNPFAALAGNSSLVAVVVVWIHTFAWDQFIIRIKFPLVLFCSIILSSVAHSIIPFVSVLSPFSRNNPILFSLLAVYYNNHKIEDAHQVWSNQEKREEKKDWRNELIV